MCNTTISPSNILTPEDLSAAVNELRRRAQQFERQAAELERRDRAYAGYLRSRPDDWPKLSLTEYWQVNHELEGLYEDQETYLELYSHVVAWCDTPYARQIACLEEMLGI